MKGSVGILNVGAGDTKLSFDPKNPAERIRAARIVKDMLRRGYALLVQDADGKYTRALDFDENTCEYIIADFDPVQAAAADAAEEVHHVHQQAEETPARAAPSEAPAEPKRRGWWLDQADL